jgi:hypothetical protein
MTKQGHFCAADAARLLGVQDYRIQYAIRTKKVSSPSIVAGRRLWTWADLGRLAEHFGVDLKNAEHDVERRKDGQE